MRFPLFSNRGSRLLPVLLLIAPEAGSGAVLEALETGIEWMQADDVAIGDGLVQWRREGPDWFHRLTLSSGWLEIDYEPAMVDIFGHPETVREERISAEWAAHYALAERWRVEGTLGAYDGFTGYRSLWVSRWYQQFFAGLPGLEEPDPRGAVATLGTRWEYLPASGFLSASFTFARDRIAPGYDEVFAESEGLVGVAPFRSELDTVAFSLATENILTGRLRSRIEYRFAQQSERDARHGLSGELRYALSRNWFARLDAGGAWEQGAAEATRDFEANWVDAGLTWELTPAWSVDLQGGFYRDNGEIENALGFSSAAPEVEVWNSRIGLRHTAGAHAWHVSLGVRSADYAPVAFNNLFFGPLYADRTFLTASAAYRWSF